MTRASAPMRRGWCPGVLTPMPTGDGLLARLHPPLGALTAAQARAVADAARACGNGFLDVTGRGNLQIRGVREESHGALVERLAAVGLVEEERNSAASQQVVALGPGLPSASLQASGKRVEALAREPEPFSRKHAAERSAAECCPGPSATICEAPNGPAESTRQRLNSGPIRLTVVSPLAGIDPADLIGAHALAEQIEAEGRAVDGLPAKTCVAVDGGGAMPLNDIEADLRVIAFGPPAAPLVAIGLGEGPQWIGTTSVSAAPRAVRAILAGFAALLRMGRSQTRRIKDLPSDLHAELASAADLGPAVAPPRRGPAPRAGLIPLSDGRAAVLAALPFGRCDAERLASAADWSERYGTGELRLSPWRGIAVPGVARADIPALAEEARRAGLILDPADPRLAVLVCPGRPACASATTDTHADAARLAGAARAALGDRATMHVSGCPKGCAHPGPADLTLVGDGGAYRVAPGGSPRDPGSARLPIDVILRRLSAVRTPQGLAPAFAEASP